MSAVIAEARQPTPDPFDGHGYRELFVPVVRERGLLRPALARMSLDRSV